MAPEEWLSVERPLRLWRQERAWTRRLVAAFPESAFGWRPAPDAFSCGELVIHLIQSERFWRRLLVEAAAGRSYDPFGLSGNAEERYAAFREPNFLSASSPRHPTTFAGCLERWAAEQAETETAFVAFTGEQLAAAIVHHPVAGFVEPLADMLWFMASHEVHHRGQLSAYAKMLGLAQPPLYTGDFGAGAGARAREAIVAAPLPSPEPRP
ncbi:MAG TPA: DinB family protein [Thermoanaerobaculia bacterium]|nr:DinB family protein [Thermoanaerobaculia bacterium]